MAITEEERNSRKIENNYYKNRKDIILSGVENHKRSVELAKGAAFLIIYFALTSIYNILYTLGNPGTNIYNSPLFISNVISFLGGLTLNSISSAYKKIAKKTFRRVEEIDNFLKNKEEYNSKEVKKIIEISNPHLFRLIQNSKLEKPVDLEIFSQMTSNDKSVTYDMVSALKERNATDTSNIYNNKDIEIIDVFEVEDKTMPKETAIRKMYTR